MFDARSFSRDALDELLNLVAANAAARWPKQTYLMTSDVVWQLPGCAPRKDMRLWYDEFGLAGYAWFQPPDALLFDVRLGTLPDDLVVAMLAWARHRRQEFEPGYPYHLDLESMDEWAHAIRHPPAQPTCGSRYLSAPTFESDTHRIGLLERNGFTATQHFEPYLARSLSTLGPAPSLPTGVRLRHVEPADFEQRVAVHSASWAPASTFDMNYYLKVRAMEPVFDPELDIVAETSDGTFASYTIAWKDPVSGIGSFEPFGTRPEWRGSGVSQAVIHEGLRRMAQKGMHSARIFTAGFNHQAVRLYEGCGFSRVDTLRTFVKQS